MMPRASNSVFVEMNLDRIKRLQLLESENGRLAFSPGSGFHRRIIIFFPEETEVGFAVWTDALKSNTTEFQVTIFGQC